MGTQNSTILANLTSFLRLLNLEGQFLDFLSIWRVFSTFELRAVKTDPKFDISRQFDEFFATFEPRGVNFSTSFQFDEFFRLLNLDQSKLTKKSQILDNLLVFPSI